MARTLRLAILVLAIVSSGPSVFARDPGAVLGRLDVDGRRGPVAGAHVTIEATDSDRTFTLVTDSRGRFGHVGIQPGAYRILVARDGFAEIEVLDVEVRSNDRVRLYLEMTPYDEAPFKRRSIRYHRPMVDTESATISSRIL